MSWVMSRAAGAGALAVLAVPEPLVSERVTAGAAGEGVGAGAAGAGVWAAGAAEAGLEGLRGGIANTPKEKALGPAREVIGREARWRQAVISACGTPGEPGVSRWISKKTAIGLTHSGRSVKENVAIWQATLYSDGGRMGRGYRMLGGVLARRRQP